MSGFGVICNKLLNDLVIIELSYEAGSGRCLGIINIKGPVVRSCYCAVATSTPVAEVQVVGELLCPRHLNLTHFNSPCTST